MNERILDLAVKSGHIVGELPLNTSEKIQLAGLEKFAELIVEEMYDFIMEESASDNGIPDLGKVKQHFGVEE